MKQEPTILLSRGQVADLLAIDECTTAIEEAFRLYGEGKAQAPGVLGIHVENGGFHLKAGALQLERNYFAAKVNANFPGNPAKWGLPTIQGVIVLCDADDGRVLAVMDSMEITALRTAAATAVAAKYLARPDSKRLTICGCGAQGRFQLRALAKLFDWQEVHALDNDAERATLFSRELSTELAIPVIVAANLREAVRLSEVCVTCTTSRKPLLSLADVRPGTFVAAVGADNPEKQEIHPSLMAGSKVVVDLVEQCATIGDLHHAIAAGAMKKSDVHAELGEIVAGKKPGRTSAEEIIIFDSTGMALQDVAAAARVYEKTERQGSGVRFDFAA
jgi:alanine dehydrogenase